MSATTHHWTASDGVRLAWHEMGEGDPVLLLHGLASNATVNWIKYGHAAKVAATGRRVIMPDLRCHGDSEAPTDPALYEAGILARDLEELVGHLGLLPGGYDLGGFSLGARTTVHAVGEGLRPARAMLCGMGLEGLTGWYKRQAFFQKALDRFDVAKRGDPDFMAIAFMKTMKVVPEAMRLLLPTFTDAKDDWLSAFTMPTAVICGTEDRDNGDPHALVAALPNADLFEVPGTHMSSVTKPELGQAMAGFLAGA
ncbi:alpha/beta fold hydrolase [Sphingomicrobium aestuariivivum]|uniref:alpha/beta fold hydrolase n=1 Tax=Sphingomicrobium aestuariivivum TaxID=1582356 RepID=UPI001FD6AE55|nr:alpha/beta fold hydrolase [Sphingomicrobium aestuariivivum]MCJ8189961.1 alpha/beta hydrolase [Sphingomicrobium aestuariivivum]